MGELVRGRFSRCEHKWVVQVVSLGMSVLEERSGRSYLRSASTDITTAVERSSIASKRLTVVLYVTRILRKVTSQSNIKGLQWRCVGLGLFSNTGMIKLTSSLFQSGSGRVNKLRLNFEV